ncbi:MAG: hypothetical protein U1D96_07130 [Eubacteriales bacterium]|nr:hypothetical protein [Bacillota bacterium]MDZ4043249.1 hypothetical protein [Eubacteriales bacterium]MDZ7611122.1 hypothetical protein [Eubacteriales bacterium]
MLEEKYRLMSVFEKAGGITSGRIQRELGWQARFGDLETIVASAWKWHGR